MAAFISSTWQGTSTRIPDTRMKLSESLSAKMINTVLPLASAQARREAQAFLAGEISTISAGSTAELSGLIRGYVRQSGAGR